MKAWATGLGGLLLGAAGALAGAESAGVLVYAPIQAAAAEPLERLEVKGLRLPIADPDGAIVATVLVDAALLMAADDKPAVEAALPFVRHELTVLAWGKPLVSDVRASRIDMAAAAALIARAAKIPTAGTVKRVLVESAVLA